MASMHYAHAVVLVLSMSWVCMHADMKATFGEKRHELNVSTYQMVILLLFNEADSLSYRDIQSATSIPFGDLKRSLQSLACVKARCLMFSHTCKMPLKAVHWILLRSTETELTCFVSGIVGSIKNCS